MHTPTQMLGSADRTPQRDTQKQETQLQSGRKSLGTAYKVTMKKVNSQRARPEKRPTPPESITGTLDPSNREVADCPPVRRGRDEMANGRFRSDKKYTVWRLTSGLAHTLGGLNGMSSRKRHPE